MTNPKGWVAELLGTFTLMFVGGGAIISTMSSEGPNLVVVALGHGLGLSMAVYATGHISGAHINPAVTIAMFTRGRITPPDAVGYIISQLAGATLGALCLNMLYPEGAVQSAKLGATLGSLSFDSANVGAVLGIEIILTFFLVTTIFSVSVDERGPKNVYGFAIGLTVAFDILCAGSLTGASMNPARSFGPALIGSMSGIEDIWSMHWVYWVAPIVGAVLAAWLYDLVLIGKRDSSSDS